MWKTKILVFISILVCFTTLTSYHCFAGLPELSFSGYLNNYFEIDPRYFNPQDNTEWSWDLWNSGRNFKPSLSHLAGWGGFRIQLNTTMGNPKSSFYAYYPINIRMNMYRENESHFWFVNRDYIALFRGRNFTFGMSPRYLDDNPLWSFTSMGDPLGAFKLVNTSKPTMTSKLSMQIGGWNFDGYYIADNWCRFVPATEKIPQQAAMELGKGKQILFIDEAPTYQMIRSEKALDNWNIGLIWGQKQAINIFPRFVDSENVLPRKPATGVGFIKQNVGLDLTGTLPLLGKSKFVMAGIRSNASWQKYFVNPDKGSEGIIESSSIGFINGDAIMLNLEDVKLGRASLKGTYYYVEPTFQWIAVRDHRYAYTYNFFDLNAPIYNSSYYGWRAMRDDDYVHRDESLRDEYESDLSKFLGLRASTILLEIPGSLRLGDFANRKTNCSVEISNVENIEYGNIYISPISGDEIVKDYRQLKTMLNYKYNAQTDYDFSILERDYLQDQDYYRELGIGFNYKIQRNLLLHGETGIAARLRNDDGFAEGYLQQAKFSLSGITGNKIKLETVFDVRHGTYERDLLKGNTDRVVNPYSYFGFLQYIEFNRNIQWGKRRINTTFAGEFVQHKSDLADVAGHSAIGYVKTNIPYSDKVSIVVTGVGVGGGKQIGFPNYKISSLIDYNISYRPFNNNTIVLQVTNRYKEEGVKTNCYVRWISRFGRHSLAITYGKYPFIGATRSIYGTQYDATFQPEKELMNKPWSHLGEKSVFGDTTNFNYYTMSWIYYF